MLETLAGIPLFQDLSSAQLDLIDPLFEHFSCPPKTVIFEQGEDPLYLYILVTGTVIIKYKPFDGPAITITRLRKGDVFGWSAVVGSRFYTSSTISASHVSTLRIKGEDLWNLVNEHPEIGKIILDRLASVVSSRWKNAHAQVQALLDEGRHRSKKEGVRKWLH